MIFNKVLDGGDIRKHVFDRGRGDVQDFGQKADKQQDGDSGEGDGRGVDLILRQSRGKTTYGAVKAADEQEQQIGSPVGSGGVGGGLAGDVLEDGE